MDLKERQSYVKALLADVEKDSVIDSEPKSMASRVIIANIDNPERYKDSSEQFNNANEVIYVSGSEIKTLKSRQQ
ncbi:MAG: hypothetical protein QXD77_01870 [Candidatus Aenigmatarchaeota archaeon]